MIPKIIHISWKSKDIFKSNSEFVRNGLMNLVNLNTDWDIQFSDDDDVDRYLKDNLDIFDYSLLKHKHIVEKLDVWRLLKLYKVGGLYTDIDRYYNIPLNSILSDNIKCVLPTCADYDFTHDFMLTDANNPIHGYALTLNLKRRREGEQSIYFLGAQTYMHSITKNLTGEEIDTNPGQETMNKLRDVINKSGFMTTYREELPVNNILFRNSNLTKQQHEQQKREFYSSQNITHWSGQW